MQIVSKKRVLEVSSIVVKHCLNAESFFDVLDIQKFERVQGIVDDLLPDLHLQVKTDFTPKELSELQDVLHNDRFNAGSYIVKYCLDTTKIPSNMLFNDDCACFTTIKDDDTNIKTLYHGSNAKFNSFKILDSYKYQLTGRDAGAGIYLGTKELASRYAEPYLYKVVANVGKELSYKGLTLSIEDVTDVLCNLDSEISYDIISNMFDVEEDSASDFAEEFAEFVIDNNDTDVDVMNELYNLAGEDVAVLDEFSKTLGRNYIVKGQETVITCLDCVQSLELIK